MIEENNIREIWEMFVKNMKILKLKRNSNEILEK